MKKLSFTCIGRMEVDHLKELLPSLVQWGDEVVYLDCESGDGSLEYAQSLGIKTLSRPNNMNLNVNKSIAMAEATGDWTFYIDPDERLTPELVAEVRQVMESTDCAAYRLPRRNHFFGCWLRYGGQYPDYQLRLFARGKAHFPNQHVHESLRVEGSIGQLRQAMIHYPYLNISQFLKKMDFYSSFEAQHLYKKGTTISLINSLYYLLYKPKTRVFRRYVLKGGFRDGLPGFFAAVFDGVGWMLRYYKLWELQKEAPKSQTHKLQK